MLGELDRRRLRHADHGVLAGAVGRERRHRAEARAGRRVDDHAAAAAAAAAAAVAHRRPDVLQAEPDALRVHGHHLVVDVLGVVEERRDDALDACVVVEAVDAAEALDRGVDVALYLRRVADIGPATSVSAPSSASAPSISSRPVPGRSTRTSEAPSRPKRVAVAPPMPPAAPVTSATLPSNLRSMALSSAARSEHIEGGARLPGRLPAVAWLRGWLGGDVALDHDPLKPAVLPLDVADRAATRAAIVPEGEIALGPVPDPSGGRASNVTSARATRRRPRRQAARRRPRRRGSRRSAVRR